MGGVVREQGRAARLRLLRRERLLAALLQLMRRCGGEGAADAGAAAGNAAAGAGNAADSSGSGSTRTTPSAEPSDAQLQELTTAQLAAAAAAAVASGAHAVRGATGPEVAQALMDYFVFKR
jgi:hypothetical protein